MASPSDDAIRQVYGDWLQVEGDPRGELIAIHAALQSARHDTALLVQERTTLEKHKSALCGRRADSSDIEWHLGFARAVTLYQPTSHIADTSRTHSEIRQVLGHPSFRFLEILRLSLEEPEEVRETAWMAAAWQEVEESLGEFIRGCLVQPTLLREVIFESPVPMRPGFLAVDLALNPFTFVIQQPE